MIEKIKSSIRGIIWRAIQHDVFNNYRPKLCHTSAYAIKGTVKGGKKLTTLLFATNEWIEYFLNLVYAEKSTTKCFGNISFDQIPSLINSEEHDVALVSSNKSFSDFLYSNGFFVLPHLVFKLDISLPWNSLYKKMDRNLRRTINRISESSFFFEVTNDPNKLIFFYYELYLPHVSRKYGKTARIVSFEECKRLSKVGGLFLLKNSQKYVSGLVYSKSGNELNLEISGVRDENLKDNAYYALRYFFVKWAMAQGYEKIVFGMSNPFFTDGTFMYKKKWGMQMGPIEDKNAGIFGVRFNNFSDGVKDFLERNPFVFSNKDSLKGVVMFYPGIASLKKQYYVSGLSGIIILNPNGISSLIDKREMSEISFERQFKDANPALVSLTEIMSEENYTAYSVDFKE